MSEILAAAVAEIDQITPDEKPRLVEIKDISFESDPTYVEIADGGVHIYWGGYDYDVGLDEIPSPLRLLGLVMHITDKAWPLMNADRVGALISLVCEAKGWNPHTGEMHQG